MALGVVDGSFGYARRRKVADRRAATLSGTLSGAGDIMIVDGLRENVKCTVGCWKRAPAQRVVDGPSPPALPPQRAALAARKDLFRRSATALAKTRRIEASGLRPNVMTHRVISRKGGGRVIVPVGLEEWTLGASFTSAVKRSALTQGATGWNITKDLVTDVTKSAKAASLPRTVAEAEKLVLTRSLAAQRAAKDAKAAATKVQAAQKKTTRRGISASDLARATAEIVSASVVAKKASDKVEETNRLLESAKAHLEQLREREAAAQQLPGPLQPEVPGFNPDVVSGGMSRTVKIALAVAGGLAAVGGAVALAKGRRGAATSM